MPCHTHFVISALLVLAFQLPASADESRPNILLILADDLAWSDLGCYGHPQHETPNLVRLAAQGMRFTQAYAPAPICSASRAAILTGKTPARLQFEFVVKDRPGSQNLGDLPLQSPPYPTNLPLKEITTAEMLSEAGYDTAYFGKWHVNMHHGGYLGWSPTHGPLQQGFEEGDSDFGGHPYAYRGGDPSDLPLQEGEYPPDSLTDKVIASLNCPHAQPFFLQWSTYYVHDPIRTRCRWLFDKYREIQPAEISDERVTYAAMVDTLDHEVGRVLAALEDSGQARNTLVIFLSDNGGHPNYTGNAPLRGSKWNLYEGGIRVPFIARWPGRVPAGAVCEDPVHGCDLLPTFAELAGAKAPPVDGVSLLPLLRDPKTELPTRPLLWHFPFYHPEKGFGKTPSPIGTNDFVTSQTRPHSALRWGHYKLLHFAEDDRLELYDLANDPGETNDLADNRPELVRQLRVSLLAGLQSGNARFAERQQ